MPRPKKDWYSVAGDDPAAHYLLDLSKQRGKMNPLSGYVTEYLDAYKVEPDEEYTRQTGHEHRDHLSGDENLLMTRFVEHRWGYKTHDTVIPGVSWWAKRLQRATSHIRVVVGFLARQGLIRIIRDEVSGRGHALHIALDVLHEKVVAWVEEQRQAQREDQKANDQDWQAHLQAVEIAQPEPEPEPEEEDELPPVAAMTPAPEWDWALPGIEKEVGHAAAMNLFGVRAYWFEGKLHIQAQSPAQYQLLVRRFWGVIKRNLSEYEVWIEPARSA